MGDHDTLQPSAERLSKLPVFKKGMISVIDTTVITLYTMHDNLPQFSVIGNGLEALTNLAHSTQILLQQVAKYRKKNFIWQLVLQIMSC